MLYLIRDMIQAIKHNAAPFVFVQCIDKATDSPVFSGRLDKLSDTGKSLVFQKIFTA